jgi:uncharacterized protein (DUF1015 family)
MRIHPFDALRPQPALAGQVASAPYDTVDTAEARALAAGNPLSFLHVNHSEIDLPDGTPLYSDAVYAQAVAAFQKLQSDGVLFRDGKKRFWLYAQTMGTHTQVGLVGCAHVDDYASGVIMRHELTRADKELDRTRHTEALGANIGPVFLAYRDVPALDALFTPVLATAPAYDFTDELSVRHRAWPFDDVAAVEKLFAEAVPQAYIADGHHRAASAARVGAARREAAGADAPPDAECNWFLAVSFPASQLRILPYNRVVRDLRGASAEAFLAEVSKRFRVSDGASDIPPGPRHVSMLLSGKWYDLAWDEDPAASPVERLDVARLQKDLLAPVLGIEDPRRDERIRFVGGIRGTKELVRLVEEEGFAVAFSMHPVTVEQLMDIADAGEIMPPKSTWFEPKLRTGLLTHVL